MFENITNVLKYLNTIGLVFAFILGCTNPVLGSAPCTCGYTAYNPFREYLRVCTTLQEDSWSSGGCENRCGANIDCFFQNLRIDGYDVTPDHSITPQIYFYDENGATQCQTWGTQSGFSVTWVTDDCSELKKPQTHPKINKRKKIR